jgi:5-carboxymethyl-2-hydroxymuconic-semialdehyde dehydrogenase/aminomuconate-semialdehyde/2-hydroxymuconate-6-semialdehyde dehydrogenase
MRSLPMAETCRSFIGGAWADRGASERLPVINPADERVIAELDEADAATVDAAVGAARLTFEAGTWSRAPVAARQAVLRRVHDLILRDAERIAALETANTGIPIGQVRDRHVPRAAMNFAFFAEVIGQQAGQLFEQQSPYLTMVRHEPKGVAALIAPWNAPIALATMELAAALAFGNSCVLKPSELTPLEFGPLMDICREAGVPDGAVNMVNGRGAVTGRALVAHDDVDCIAFIGGTETGREIGAAAGRGLKTYLAELGGKSANIITADADLDRALDAALVGIFSNNGQQCLAGSRILVERRVADGFIARFVERARRLRLGDPMQPATEIGPVISRAQYERVLRFAADTGADLLVGGTRADGFDRGFYLTPSVALARSNAAPVCQEEIFGPFATFLVFDDIDEAIAIANDSRYGLVGYLWSEHWPTIAKVTRELRTGTIWVNTPVSRDLRAPFGGYKQSGVGRTGADASRHHFTEEKVVTLPLADFPIGRMGVAGDR